MVNYTPKLLTGLPSEFESFHKAVREGLPSPVPAEEVLNVAKIFDALYESARIGRSVSISLIYLAVKWLSGCRLRDGFVKPESLFN